MGTHTLIKEGAKLVTHVGDILEELPPLAVAPHPRPADEPASPAPPADLSEQERAVFDALSPYPVHVDELIRQVDMDPGRMAGVLLTLELQGLVRQEPGKLFRLTEKPAPDWQAKRKRTDKDQNHILRSTRE